MMYRGVAGRVISSEVKQILESIGVELDSREMQVLRAVIKAGGGLSKHATFEEIYQRVNAKRKDFFSKAWVYKCLSNLKESGYITVISIGNPKQYMATEESIMTALAIRKREQLDILQKEKETMLDHQQSFDNINLPRLAVYLIKTLMNSLESEGSRIIEGADNIRKAIATEICSCAKAGDTIRTTGYFHIAESGSSGPAEEILLRTVFDGVTVLGLILPSIPLERGMNLLGQYMNKLGKTLVEAFTTGNLKVKVTKEGVLTYRMISLNSEKMILYLTNMINCGGAALILRSDNSRLIDDAILTFDNLWNESFDMTKQMATLFSKRN